ncbi:MAG: sugar ABC transporter ATP-binding protein [Actinobacteria bacterium]|nr:sugar ABC transporter ATP-binding protein [Actinomycetota bacterium]
MTEPSGNMRTADGAPTLEVRGISRAFGSVQALRDVSLVVRPGEVVGLVGDNGAGKSTLVKIISGAQAPSSGEILVGGQRVEFHTPKASRAMGIEVVYQDLALATELTVAENIFLGREIKYGGLLRRLGVLNRRKMRVEAEKALASLGITIQATTTRCGLLSGGQRQAVAVARAIMWGSKVLLLDEPTAALAVAETEKIGELVKAAARHGVAILLISHDMAQVRKICDRVAVLLRGELVADLPTESTSIEDIVLWITGGAMVVSE